MQGFKVFGVRVQFATAILITIKESILSTSRTKKLQRHLWSDNLRKQPARAVHSCFPSMFFQEKGAVLQNFPYLDGNLQKKGQNW